MIGRKSGARPSCLVGACLLLALALTSGSRVADAQAPAQLFFVPGRNVNTVGRAPTTPTPDLAGNPHHKQRNEASCDVSPSNAMVVLCANNDYRGVELFGDSWIGISTTTNAGLNWQSRLLEGFPTTPSGIGAADPVVKTMPGVGLINYITLSRTDGRGTLALAVLLERNRENGEPYQFLEKRIVGNGTPGRFNDKPVMTAVLHPAGGFVDVGGRQVPRVRILVSYALFPGNENNSNSQIYHLYSDDHGKTWTADKKLSESLGVNQGVDLAVAGNTIVATWRHVADTNEPDNIVYARSTDGGASWTKAQVLWAGPGRFFDQDSTPLQFRTRSMPSIVHDGSAFHVFFSARGFAANPDDARIVVSSSRDGRQWSAPVPVNNYAGRGHQIMPQAAVAGGRLQVNWIDTRNNEPGTFGRFITDFGEDAAGNRVPLDSTTQTPSVIYRHSADILAAQAAAAAPNGQPSLEFTSPVQISRYRFGLVPPAPGATPVRRQLEYNFVNARMFQRGNLPFHGDYHALAGQRHRPSETTPGAWITNTAPSTSHAIFYSAFTDNRDVQGYVWAGPPGSSFTPSVTQEGEPGTETPTACTPSGTTPDLTVWSPNDSTRSRYQNIYAAATLPGLLVTTPSRSKPNGAVGRAYVIFAQNLTGADRTYRFSIANQPGDAPPLGTGRASFRPNDVTVPATSCVDGAACTQIIATIGKASSVTRTVYVDSSIARPRIVVHVEEQGGELQTGSVILNADPNVSEIENPVGGDFPDIRNFEVYQPDILQRQATLYSAGIVNPDITPVEIQNPRVEYPRIEFPRVEYPRIEFPRIEFPRIEFDALGNPRVEYPRVEYPRVEYSAVENPRIEFSALSADDVAEAPVAVTDVTWAVTTEGANTTTAMASKVFVNGTLTDVLGAQMIVTIPQFTTVVRSCDGQAVTIVENQIVVNTVVDPASLAKTEGGPDTVNPPLTQPTFFVQPNQVAYVTLRLVGRADALLARRAGIIVRSQPDTSDGDETDEDDDPGFVDSNPPVISLGALEGGVTVEGNKPGGGEVKLLVTATDESGEASLSCVRTGGGVPPSPVASDGTAAFFALGSWQVTCTAVDPFGHESTAGFPVTVVDTTPPTLDVGTIQISLTFTAGGAIVTYNAPAATATDIVDATPTVQCTPPSGTFMALGTGQVTCTATDDSGNVATAVRSFPVSDTVAPVLTLPQPIVVEATSSAGATPTFSATAVDLVDATPTVACTPPSGSVFPLGVTTVSCTASDDSGNTSSGSFTVTVRDTAPPTSITATVTPATLWPPNGAIVPVTVTGRALDAASGVTTIEWRVVDEYRQHQPTGSAPVAADGTFSFQVPLLADRRGNDKDGRHYSIMLTAVDAAGNRLALSQPLVVNVHDQSGM